MDAPVSFANPEVLAFYQTLPFNEASSAEIHAAAIRADDPVRQYPVLPPLLRAGTRVLEVGSGTGWFSLAMAHHYRADVTAIDFNPVAVERARQVATVLDAGVSFSVADLFLYDPPRPFDVVVSLGVLHHTNDCHAAVARVFDRFVRPGGHVLVGLYHRHGRAPFLRHFREMRARGASEAEMLARYRELHSWLDDDTQALSWFRDQVQHPHETQHTLAEFLPLMRAHGMELVATSINRFQPIGSIEAVLAEERDYAVRAEQYLAANRYFTGFFVFLCRKNGA
jgi:2-polyprenyl-3-methyl-5-hydroxy-6-metoxy-1,4-benzoquinol methylase